MKLLQRLLISLLLLLSTPLNSFAVYEYNVAVNKTGEDYNTITLAEGALDDAGDITSTATKCGAWDACTAGTCDAANLTDGESVTWDGAVSTGTLRHLTSTEYMITVTLGTLDDNDTVTDLTNTFQINGAGDSCQVTIDVYNDDGDLTDSPTIDGFTTDSDNYIKIHAPSGERHNGTISTGAKWISGAGVIAILDNYVYIEWLVITSSTSDGTNYEGLIQPRTGASNSKIQNNIIYNAINASTGTYTAAIGSSTQTYTNLYIYNNIIYGSETDGASFGFGNAGVVLLNNTIYNSGRDGIGIRHSNSSVTARNNASFLSATSDYGANIDTRQTNASEDATGDAGLTSLTASLQFTNLTGGSENFHLISGAGLIDTGTDLTTTGNIDIDNYDRDAGGVTWDIGADEFIASAGTTGTASISGLNLSGTTISGM